MFSSDDLIIHYQCSHKLTANDDSRLGYVCSSGYNAQSEVYVSQDVVNFWNATLGLTFVNDTLAM